MKKTLITLLALGGMLGMSAYATETTTLKLSDAKLTSNGAEMNVDAEDMETSKDFTLTMSINANKLMELLATSAPTETNTWIAKINTERSGNSSDYFTGLAVVYASASNDTDASLMAGYYNTGNKLVGTNFNVTDGTTSITYLSSIVSSAWGYDSTTKTSDTIKAAAVTISGTVGSNFSICLTMKKADGSLLEYTGTTSGYSFGNTTDINSITFDNDVVYSAYYFDSITTTENAKTLNAALVPEPTTATLSLLALAGLAARRRRK